MNTYDIWWTGLTVKQKERIAKKVTGVDTFYPAATNVWMGLPEDRKARIYEHCKSGHGYLDPVENEGNPLTD